MHKPTTTFDALVYIDGTLAGLAILIPIPPVDWVLEMIFRRRMIKAISARRKIPVSAEVQALINRGEPLSCWGCWLWPLTAVFYLLKRFSRKILYFLTIKEATDQVSYYWHRAFLLDYMIVEGHLANLEKAALAQQAMRTVLADTTTSPLYKFATEWIRGVRHNWRITLRLFRSRNIRHYLQENETLLKDNWNAAAGYLSTLALRYNDLYLQLEIEQKIRIEEIEEIGEASATAPINEQSKEDSLAPQAPAETESPAETQANKATDATERDEKQEN
jgi:hypothetical protein